MTIQQTLIGGKTPRFVGYTMTSSGINQELVFDYPSGSSGDLIIAYVLAENSIEPSLPDGWVSLYSNTTTLTNGPGAGRRLMYKIRQNETNTTVQVSGGGSSVCVSLRDYRNTFGDVIEYVANNTVGNTAFKYYANTNQIFLTLVNHDGAVENPVITIANTTSYHTEPGNFRSMALGYIKGNTTSSNCHVYIPSESAYGVYFTVT